MAEINCVVVTPEKTALSVVATSIRLPMDDGSLGILPGRAPMIGRLGYGQMTISTSSGSTDYYIDGGFVQVTRDSVNVLTDQLQTMGDLDASESQQELTKALEMSSKTPELMQLKEKSIRRARAKVSLTSK